MLFCTNWRTVFYVNMAHKATRLVSIVSPDNAQMVVFDQLEILWRGVIVVDVASA